MFFICRHTLFRNRNKTRSSSMWSRLQCAARCFSWLCTFQNFFFRQKQKHVFPMTSYPIPNKGFQPGVQVPEMHHQPQTRRFSTIPSDVAPYRSTKFRNRESWLSDCEVGWSSLRRDWCLCSSATAALWNDAKLPHNSSNIERWYRRPLA